MEEIDFNLNDPFGIEYEKPSMETISTQIDDWVQRNIPEFSFREHQKEAIASVIYNIVAKEKRNHIVEAPTGSGKSLIAIISAGVLSDFYQKRSYILCSDLFLWDQYDVFIKKHSLRGFASIKGQTGNYICMKNHEDMRNAECRLDNVSWMSLMSGTKAKEYPCCRKCEYVQARKKVKSSPIVLTTYQCLLYQLNRPKGEASTQDEEYATFTNRDVFFCDECHNVPSICNGKFTPTMKLADLEHYKEIYMDAPAEENLFTNKEQLPMLYQKYPTWKDAQDKFVSIFNRFLNEKNTCEEDFELFKEYYDFSGDFFNEVERIELECKEDKERLGHQPKENVKRYKQCSWYRNTQCYMGDFISAIENTSSEFLIKNINESNKDKTLTVSISCSKEDFIVSNYLLSHSDYRVFLSATVGDVDSYIDNCGIERYLKEEYKMERIPSTFDFSKSPVFYWGKYKMSMRDKERSFPILCNTVYQIMKTKFPNMRGIIQTGSYANAKYFVDHAPAELKNRFLLYNDSGEKALLISHHKMCENTVLIGPSLTEGIDLPDDSCRFIIILKVPFPQMMDKLVQAKIKLFPKWYDSETSNSIIQGIGRGNRNPNDWCVTYILDGCFGYLYSKTRKQYSEELQKRIKFV